MDNKVLLDWYLESGVDEAVDNTPQNRFLPTQKAASAPEVTPPAATQNARPVSNLQHSPSAAIMVARKLADNCHSLQELEAAVREFDGCALKKTASKTVFSDGNPNAKVMLIGEAPGAEEDKQGIPFCGPSGKLLDRTLASIGLTREETVYISNTIFWRPPGNRQPSTEETAICEPFVEKHIALIKPKLLILAGGVATKAVLKNDTSVSRLRGRFYDYQNDYMEAPVKTVIIYHPSYLLRSPGQKRLAWHDMLLIQDFLNHN